MGFPVLRFGDLKKKTYVFPDTITQFSHNFGNGVPQTVRLPGADGGFDPFGMNTFPSEVGTIRVTFMLTATHAPLMTTLVDQVMAMAGWGRQRLWVQPANRNYPPRWTWAKVNNIQITQNAGNGTDFLQPVTIIFQCQEPRFFSANTDGLYFWGIGHRWGSGTAFSAKWGSGTETLMVSGDTMTLYNYGNAVAYPRIFIRVPSPNAWRLMTLQRVADGEIRENIDWNGIVENGDTIIIDCRRRQVWYNGSDGYNSSFHPLTPQWFSLDPGVNHLRMWLSPLQFDPGTFGSVPITDTYLRVAYYDTWYNT